MLPILFWGQIATETPETEPEAKYYIIAGDSIPREYIDLDEVVILQRLKFDSKEDQKHYLILRRKVKKVWPFAKLAGERFVQLNQRLDSLEGKRAKKKYTKIIQRYVENEFTDDLKKLTRSEGQILVKLLHRQTGSTGFDLIKDYRSGWKAFWLNTTASMFDISLKEPYDPEHIKDDFYIEDILQRSFQFDLLEEQKSAYEIDYFKLREIWLLPPSAGASNYISNKND